MRAAVAFLLVGCAAPDGKLQSAITNGAIDFGDSAVAMIVTSGGQIVCSGSIIAPHALLTAAHCEIDAVNFDQFGAVLPPMAGAQAFSFSNAMVHPAFDESSFDNDLLLITLFERAKPAPLALDSRPVDASLVGQSFTVVGYGSTSATTQDDGTKRSGTAQVTAVDALDFTAAAAPSQPCAGDSGGPALFLDGGNQVLTGVVSHGDSNCSDHAAFARIDVARASFIDPFVAGLTEGTATTGDRCFYDEQCAGGPCLQANDEPRRFFCGRACTKTSDCPKGMTCAADGCRYTISPGALGTSCMTAGDCASGACETGRCTESCVPTGNSCPAGFECKNTRDISFFCMPADKSVESGCAIGGGGADGAAWWCLALLGMIVWRRRAI